ncbi:MAG: PD-(D/E)XK nuclease family transposase [Lachnospiraceae bacterium]|nr:PD-(D/E)XK nuclease family transposase [Lachnospiraceae bacterium]
MRKPVITEQTQVTSPASTLKKHFPQIRTRQELRQMIFRQPALNDLFMRWSQEYQEDFLDRCTGLKGMKVLYDGIFKEIFNPEVNPERLSELLSLLMERKAVIQTVLPNDSVRLGAESSLLYMDIIVQLEDGSLCNVEIQKIGYAFPGQRCACYSADHLLRQYKRVKSIKGDKFNYRDIKQVYTIVFFERSPSAFHDYPQNWLHKFCQQSNTGLTMELLQEYFFIPLDIYRKSMENKAIENDLEAWLAFLSFTEPSRMEELITKYPSFKAMYQDIYELCLNTEKVMSMYSKELEILDRNTVMYMIDEMQEQIDTSKKIIAEQKQAIDGQRLAINEQQQTMAQQKQELQEKEREIAALKAQLAAAKAHQP